MVAKDHIEWGALSQDPRATFEVRCLKTKSSCFLTRWLLVMFVLLVAMNGESGRDTRFVTKVLFPVWRTSQCCWYVIGYINIFVTRIPKDCHLHLVRLPYLANTS